jgi:hypothetical protein
VQVWDKLRAVIACFFVYLFVVPSPALFAQTHVVSSADLQRATVATTQARKKNIETLNNFFSSPVAQKALREKHINSEQLRQATLQLSDAELAQLAARADKAQKDFAAGAITDHLLVLLVIAIAAILIIILAVKL